MKVHVGVEESSTPTDAEEPQSKTGSSPWR